MICEVCQHEPAEGYVYGIPLRTWQLCEFCSSTFAAHPFMYPEQWDNASRQASRLIAQLYWKLKA
jgi:hypothetical protein